MAYSDDRPPEQTIEFVGSQGHALSGRLHLPPERAKGAVLLAHCFSCSKDLHTMTRLSKGLVDAGYAALRFDFTGLGDSGGDFAETQGSSRTFNQLQVVEPGGRRVPSWLKVRLDPSLEAINAYSPSCSTRMRANLRSLPLLDPTLVTMITGIPVSIRVLARVPPDASYSAT
jgi:fermentation-respiration switch protein FrsA (DUF1100 family)